MILKNLITIDDIMKNYPSLELNSSEALRIKHGQKINVSNMKHFGTFMKKYPSFNEIDCVYCFTKKNPIALSKIRDDVVKPIKVFNL